MQVYSSFCAMSRTIFKSTLTIVKFNTFTSKTQKLGHDVKTSQKNICFILIGARKKVPDQRRKFSYHSCLLCMVDVSLKDKLVFADDIVIYHCHPILTSTLSLLQLSIKKLIQQTSQLLLFPSMQINTLCFTTFQSYRGHGLDRRPISRTMG